METLRRALELILVQEFIFAAHKVKLLSLRYNRNKKKRLLQYGTSTQRGQSQATYLRQIQGQFAGNFEATKTFEHLGSPTNVSM